MRTRTGLPVIVRRDVKVPFPWQVRRGVLPVVMPGQTSRQRMLMVLLDDEIRLYDCKEADKISDGTLPAQTSLTLQTSKWAHPYTTPHPHPTSRPTRSCTFRATTATLL